ncbi:hypothetical protein [Caulobacter sp.]|jgi:hypothetical protein
MAGARVEFSAEARADVVRLTLWISLDRILDGRQNIAALLGKKI